MDDRPAVADTTPLISLVGINQLALLPRLYGEIWIPDSVLAEYRAGASAVHPQLETLPWIIVQTVITEPTLQAVLDNGEAAAITLATAAHARVVILDELRGRQIARQRALPLVGSLGILLRAKQQGLLTAVPAA